ncbi:hypothetical protein FA13DRAFT_1778170, partial [Coprinellus micaceus]
MGLRANDETPNGKNLVQVEPSPVPWKSLSSKDPNKPRTPHPGCPKGPARCTPWSLPSDNDHFQIPEPASLKHPALAGLTTVTVTAPSLVINHPRPQHASELQPVVFRPSPHTRTLLSSPGPNPIQFAVQARWEATTRLLRATHPTRSYLTSPPRSRRRLPWERNTLASSPPFPISCRPTVHFPPPNPVPSKPLTVQDRRFASKIDKRPSNEAIRPLPCRVSSPRSLPMGPEANDLLSLNHRRSWERNLGVMRLGWAPTAWRSRPQLFLAVGPRRGLECMLRSLVPRRSAYAAEYSSPRRRRGGQAKLWGRQKSQKLPPVQGSIVGCLGRLRGVGRGQFQRKSQTNQGPKGAEAASEGKSQAVLQAGIKLHISRLELFPLHLEKKTMRRNMAYETGSGGCRGAQLYREGCPQNFKFVLRNPQKTPVNVSNVSPGTLQSFPAQNPFQIIVVKIPSKTVAQEHLLKRETILKETMRMMSVL